MICGRAGRAGGVKRRARASLCEHAPARGSWWVRSRPRVRGQPCRSPAQRAGVRGRGGAAAALPPCRPLGARSRLEHAEEGALLLRRPAAIVALRLLRRAAAGRGRGRASGAHGACLRGIRGGARRRTAGRTSSPPLLRPIPLIAAWAARAAGRRGAVRGGGGSLKRHWRAEWHD